MGSAQGKRAEFDTDFVKVGKVKMVNKDLPGLKFVNVPTSETLMNGAYVL